MTPRRDKMTPYEVIRAAGGPRSVAAPRPGAGAATPEPVEQVETESSAGRGGAGPLVLRVPRGMAVALGLGLVGLILLAYAVGHSQGWASARAAVAAEAQEQTPVRMRGVPEIELVGTAALGDEADARTGGPVRGGETRTAAGGWQVGLNYLCLATYPHEDAARLAEFVRREHGLDVGVIPYDNNRSQVICRRGFEWADERGRHELRSLIVNTVGPAWKRHNGNRGHDLSDAGWDLYEKGDNWP